MCLLTKQKRAYKAKRDITVYKVLDNELRSLAYPFKYKEEKLYFTSMLSTRSWGREFLFDSLDVEETCQYFKIDNLFELSAEEEIKLITQGFHSASSIERLTSSGWWLGSVKRVVVECTIPKGSLYYKNPKKSLLVSNQIVINKIVKR